MLVSRKYRADVNALMESYLLAQAFEYALLALVKVGSHGLAQVRGCVGIPRHQLALFCIGSCNLVNDAAYTCLLLVFTLLLHKID